MVWIYTLLFKTFLNTSLPLKLFYFALVLNVFSAEYIPFKKRLQSGN